MTIESKQTPKFGSAFSPVLESLEALYRQVNSSLPAEQDFETIARMLDSLALATYELGTALLRLNRAKIFVNAKENGAAAWEVRAVMLQMREIAESVAAHPHYHDFD